MSAPIDELGVALSSGNTDYINWASGNPATSGSSGSAVPASAGTDYAKMAYDEQQQSARQSASAFLRDTLSQYGLGSLAGAVDSLVSEWGTNSGVLMEKIRDTDAYKTRFQGLVALRNKGVTDVQNEAQYLQLESQYRQVFRDAGLSSYIGDPGSAAEQASIAKIVGDYSLSVNEVKQRVDDAARLVNDQTHPEVLQQFQDYYNVAPSDLVAQALNIKGSTEAINTKVNAAITGAAAKGYGLDASSATAERIAQGAAGNGDLNAAQLAQQLDAASNIYTSTSRLANIEHSSLTGDEALRDQFALDPTVSQKVRGLQSRERARFAGTSGIGQGSLSRPSGF